VPEDWMPTPQEIAAAQKNRASAVQADQQLKALPGQAAIMKAQAITAKAQAGENIGGTLSGTAPGQNPEVPGNPPGQPGQPGPPGQPGQVGQPGA
jgi:hypothetical protein